MPEQQAILMRAMLYGCVRGAPPRPFERHLQHLRYLETSRSTWSTQQQPEHAGPLRARWGGAGRAGGWVSGGAGWAGSGLWGRDAPLMPLESGCGSPGSTRNCIWNCTWNCIWNCTQQQPEHAGPLRTRWGGAGRAGGLGEWRCGLGWEWPVGS